MKIPRIHTMSVIMNQVYLTNNRTVTKKVDVIRSIWRRADCVTFDVDSTVCVDEAIDELALFMGVGEKVMKLTNAAMGGKSTFKESLSNRLNLIRPSQNDLIQFIREHPPRFTRGIQELVSLLHERGVVVYLVSGGFQAIIEPVARALGIPRSNIFANDILFDENGEYAGFDEERLTCAEGGKPRVMQLLRDSYDYRTIVHLGDGATDLEACPPADAFIGFGGNQVRAKVRQGCPWFVTDFTELIDVLNTTS